MRVESTLRQADRLADIVDGHAVVALPVEKCDGCLEYFTPGLECQQPFDTAAQQGDPTFRLIPSDVDVSRLRIAHTHYSHERAEKDINVIFPIERLRALAWEGTIGSLATSFYSFGFDLHVKELVGPDGSASQIAGRMVEEGVDAALFTPG